VKNLKAVSKRILSTPIIKANVRHTGRAMQKINKIKSCSDGRDSGTNKCKRGYDGAYDGV
jgi:hypothetical protein